MAGGEDYELCFIAPAAAAAALKDAVAAATSTPVTVVGEIVSAEQGRRLVLPNGQGAPLDPSGWEHFRQSA